MFRLITNIYFLMLLMFAFPLTSIAQEHKITIKGRVVDESGQPVAGVFLNSDIPENFKKRTHCNFHTEFTDKDGRFILTHVCKKIIKGNYYFFLIPPKPENSKTAIDSSFKSISPRHYVYFDDNRVVDTGDLVLRVWIREVKFFILNNDGTPFYKTQEEWKNLRIRVLDEQGDGYEGGLSMENLENHINIEKGSISLAFPEGQWNVMLYDRQSDDRTQKRKVFGSSKIFVNKSEKLLEINFIVN